MEQWIKTVLDLITSINMRFLLGDESQVLAWIWRNFSFYFINWKRYWKLVTVDVMSCHAKFQRLRASIYVLWIRQPMWANVVWNENALRPTSCVATTYDLYVFCKNSFFSIDDIYDALPDQRRSMRYRLFSCINDHGTFYLLQYLQI